MDELRGALSLSLSLCLLWIYLERSTVYIYQPLALFISVLMYSNEHVQYEDSFHIIICVIGKKGISNLLYWCRRLCVVLVIYNKQKSCLF